MLAAALSFFDEAVYLAQHAFLVLGRDAVYAPHVAVGYVVADDELRIYIKQLDKPQLQLQLGYNQL